MVTCIAACSDGVWDNWKWAEVGSYFLDPQRVEGVLSSNTCESAIEGLMRENAQRAEANFGSQADNSTAVACYIFFSE